MKLDPTHISQHLKKLTDQFSITQNGVELKYDLGANSPHVINVEGKLFNNYIKAETACNIFNSLAASRNNDTNREKDNQSKNKTTNG